MGFLSKIGFDSHHKIERFGVTFIALVVSMAVLFGIGVVKQVNNENAVFSTKSIYTDEFETSRSGVKGTVAGLYKSTDGKGVICMIKFADDAKMSTDATNYNVYMTSADVKGNKSFIGYKPAGSVYVFGSTGYLGIYLYNNEGFPSQILDLTVRCNSELINNTETSRTLKEGQDESFLKYDQFKVLVNPGAEECEVSKSLDEEVLDIGKFYRESICLDEEKQIREECDKAVDEMRVSLNTIREYRTQLDSLSMSGGSLHVVVPDDPELIRGDVVEEELDEKGKKTGIYTYKPANIVSGGVDFDYKKTDIADGYFKLVTDSTSHGMWASEMRAKPQDAFTVSMNWYLNDGSIWQGINSGNNSVLNTGLSGSDKDVIAVNQTIINLENAWSTYWQQKVAYERKLLFEFLDMELDVESVQLNYSVNNDEKVITVY